jgi:hypothetical protein
VWQGGLCTDFWFSAKQSESIFAPMGSHKRTPKRKLNVDSEMCGGEGKREVVQKRRKVGSHQVLLHCVTDVTYLRAGKGLFNAT